LERSKSRLNGVACSANQSRLRETYHRNISCNERGFLSSAEKTLLSQHFSWPELQEGLLGNWDSYNYRKEWFLRFFLELSLREEQRLHFHSPKCLRCRRGLVRIVRSKKTVLDTHRKVTWSLWSLAERVLNWDNRIWIFGESVKNRDTNHWWYLDWL